jgi:hypothetical protein
VQCQHGRAGGLWGRPGDRWSAAAGARSSNTVARHGALRGTEASAPGVTMIVAGVEGLAQALARRLEALSTGRFFTLWYGREGGKPLNRGLPRFRVHLEECGRTHACVSDH